MAVNPNRDKEEKANDVAIAVGGLRGDASGLLDVVGRAKTKKVARTRIGRPEVAEVSEQREKNRQVATDRPVVVESPKPESSVAQTVPTEQPGPVDSSNYQSVNLPTADKLDLVRFQVKVREHHDDVFEKASAALAGITGCKIKKTNLTRGFAEMVEHILPMLERMAEQGRVARKQRPSNNEPDGIMELDRRCGAILHQAVRDSETMKP